MKRFILLFGFTVCGLCSFFAADFSFPYHGRLMGVMGDTSDLFSKAYKMRVALYTVPQSGVALWSRDYPAVNVDAEGNFVLELRDIEAHELTLETLVKEHFPLYVGLSVATTAGAYEEEISPRVQLSSLPIVHSSVVARRAGSKGTFDTPRGVNADGLGKLPSDDPLDPARDFPETGAITAQSLYVEGDLTVDGSIKLTGKLESAEVTSVPYGTVVAYAGDPKTLPKGWVLCDGQTNVRVTPQETTFTRVPDLRGRFIVGAGNRYPQKSLGGEAKVTLKETNLPEHTHKEIVDETAESFTMTTWERLFNNGDDSAYLFHGVQHGTPLPDSSGGGQSHNNLPPYRQLHFIMRVYAVQ